jgi:tetratricopeptide (TPR) repeat protein
MDASDDGTSRTERSNQNTKQGGWKPVALAMVIFLTAAGARGQAPAAGGAKADSDYSKEAFIIEKLRTVATFENDGTGSRATSSTVRVQSQAGVEHWGVIAAGYSSTNEQVEIGYVRVRKADGTLVETPADSAQDVTSEITRAAPMYSDYHEKHVAVKGLGVGDVLEYQVTIRLHTPFIVNQFGFGYDFEKTAIVLDEEVEVNVPKDREVKVKGQDLKPAIAEEGKRRVYTWKTANRETKKDDEPRREFPPPAILVSTFQSWKEVGRWWNGLEQEQAAPPPEIRAKAAELTRDATTREEKVRALYSYVSTHFRYIGISFGIGRYQPHAAVEVLKNEYGDCKDKHTLLASLLRAGGIEAFPALMNSSRHIDPEVPSPGQFDHVITAVPETPNGDKLIWLDTTTEVAPFGFLAFALRDKQALVIPSAAPPLLVTTPANPPFRSFQHYEIDAKLGNNGILVGIVHRIYRGDTELLVRTLFRQTPQLQWKDLAQVISQGDGFGGDLSDVKADSPELTNAPYGITYQYTRRDYPDWPNRIMAPLGFLSFPDIKEEEKRTQPILLGAVQEFTWLAKVTLPQGYTPTLLKGVDLVRDFAEYHSSYAFNDGVFMAEARLVIKQCEVPLSALSDYKSFQNAVSASQRRYTELSGEMPPPVFTPSGNPAAEGLFQDAEAALLRHDLYSAANSLEQALKLDDHYVDAWLGLGSVRLAQGRTEEGLTAFHKAIELGPKDARSYRLLGDAYMSLRRPQEAISLWQDFLKQDPNNSDAHANLGTILLNLKRYGEAVPHFEAAVAVNKTSSSLNIALANAYIGAGSPNKAETLLKKTADVALNPVIWNDAAYALADNNLSLPEAQLYAERAVRAVEDDTAKVRLDKLERADLNRMTLLASFWDTLGWVHFREGDFSKAQKYLEASWNLEQSQVVGEHLAQIYEKQGKQAAASHQNALADRSTGGDDSAPPVTRRGGYVPSDTGKESVAEELSKLRRTELGKVSTLEGSAEFFVLIAPGGKVEDVKFISGTEQIRPLGKTLSTLKFKAPLPDDAPVKLVRRGVLVCEGKYFGCDFTLFPVDSVRSVE